MEEPSAYLYSRMSNTTQSAHPLSPEFFTKPQFKAIFEYSGMGIALAELSGTTLLSNPALQRLPCYTAESFRPTKSSSKSLFDLENYVPSWNMLSPVNVKMFLKSESSEPVLPFPTLGIYANQTTSSFDPLRQQSNNV